MIIAAQPIITGQPDKARCVGIAVTGSGVDDLFTREADEAPRFFLFADLAILSVDLIL